MFCRYPPICPHGVLDGVAFATSDLNDLYRRVITAITSETAARVGAPDVIVRNEKRFFKGCRLVDR